MKEVVVISGKGGTGKTSIAASFAYLGGESVILADCDVDAADMHLLMQPDFAVADYFYSGELAVIDAKTCIGCGCCEEVCRFNAISVRENIYVVDPLSCEGCGYCSKICSVGAISNLSRIVGKSYVSGIKTGSKMAHASLKIGADNSGKLVAEVKKNAKKLAVEKNAEMIIVDGSPGIGCPVVSSLSGADYVVLVTEPSVSGLHDLKRVYALVKKFRIRAGCIINKYDLNEKLASEIRNLLASEGIDLIAEFPYSDIFSHAIGEGKTIPEYNANGPGEMLLVSWNKLKTIINLKPSK